MSDHYKTLGISKTASKPEIKDAFRKLAIQFHPDKHSHSSQPARDAATHKFKQVSEAYDVLIDDRKRAAYNISLYNPTNNNYSYRYGYGYGYDSSYYQRGRSYYRRPMSENAAPRFGSRLEAVLKYMTTRSFLLHLTLAGMVLGGSVAIDRSMEALWKMANHGKSFEEAMESIDHNKARKDE